MTSLIVLALITLVISSLWFFFSSSSKKKSNTTRGNGAPLPPGPKGFPVLGNLPQLGPKPHQTLHSFSEVYGPLFGLKFGVADVVVASSADVAEQFLRVHDANFCDRPPNSGAEHIAYNYQDLVFAPYGPRWRMLRRLCAVHLFSARALDDLREVRACELATLARGLFRADGRSPVNVGRALTVCATDALAQAMLGRRVFGEEGEAAAEFKAMVVELMRLAGVFNVSDFVPWLKPLDPQGVVRRMKKLHRKFDAFLDKIIDEHRRMDDGSAGGGGDLLSVLMGLKENVDGEGGKLTDIDIKALLLNLFAAGTDTSASTTEWALAELIRQPNLMAQAQEELDSVVGRARLVSEADLANLPFMQAIIKEAFRLHPSTPLSLPHMAAEACEVAGYHIPAKATLLVNVWAISRDPKVWPSPLEFRPARFLPGGDHAHVDVKGNDFEIIPFGAGRRICAGLSLGLRMVQIMTATLVHSFNWALADGLIPEKLDMKEAFGLTLQRAVPLMVHPTPRLDKEAYAVDR